MAVSVVRALGAASPASAYNGDHIKNCDSSLFLTLSGVFFEPPDPCVTAGKNVSLTGQVHVVTHVEAVVGEVPDGPLSQHGGGDGHGPNHQNVVYQGGRK